MQPDSKEKAENAVRASQQKALPALACIRARAAASGLGRMTAEEIDAEIHAARRERKERERKESV